MIHQCEPNDKAQVRAKLRTKKMVFLISLYILYNEVGVLKILFILDFLCSPLDKICILSVIINYSPLGISMYVVFDFFFCPALRSVYEQFFLNFLC